MKKILLLLSMAFFCHFLNAQVTPVQPKASSVVTLRTIPPTQAVQIRTDTKNLKTQLEKLSDSVASMQRDLNMLVESLKSKLDSKDEMSEADKLALQTAMERMNKAYSTISNMMKKMHDTQQSIIGNLK